MMDPVTRFLNTENAGTQTGVAREFLAKNTRPIYSCIKHADFPAVELYPLEEVDEGLRVYVTSTTQLHTLLLMQYGRK